MTPDIYDVLNYPQRKKNKELEHVFDNLGVELIPFGEKKIFGVPVLGKGWSSIVIYGMFRGKKAAVKIQRADSHRISLKREASFLRIVNEHEIGPVLYHEGENFLIMEYLEGIPIRETVIEKKHIISFFEQCNVLDLLKIDHSQIQGGKHLIVGEKCWIIDFEKAGYRTPRNVSSLISELFLKKTAFARELKARFCIDKDYLIAAIRQYKHCFDGKVILDALQW
ncbi:MAG: hypothetical protein AYK18_00450 [Theionarchaea archaeon DG-70]|nr:MAG: hypothetical protein AYK18_00450 [Theionarchaea archaeon DG-70]